MERWFGWSLSPARRSIRRFPPGRAQRCVMSKRLRLLREAMESFPSEFLVQTYQQEKQQPSSCLRRDGCEGALCFLMLMMGWLPGVLRLWHSITTSPSHTVVEEMTPMWSSYLAHFPTRGRQPSLLKQCHQSTQSPPMVFPPRLEPYPWSLQAFIAPKLGGKRGAAVPRPDDNVPDAAPDGAHESRRRRRSRTPARASGHQSNEAPRSQVRTTHDVATQTDRIIEEVTVVSVRILGRVPISYDLHMQDVVTEAYRNNGGVISPSVVESVLFQAYPRELGPFDRLTFVQGSTALNHTRGFPDWMLSMATVDAIPSQSMGATSQSPSQATFMQAWQIAQEVNSRTRELPEPTVKFLLRSQPKLCSRLLGAKTAEQSQHLLRAAAKRAAIPVSEAPIARPKPSVQSSVQSPPPLQTPHASRPGESRSDRWRRSQKPHDDSHSLTEQWRTVTRRKSPDISLKLEDEWSVPVIDTPHWGSPGIVYCENASQAKLWAAAYAKSLQPVAIASRVKLGIESETCTVERLAFHAQRTVTRGEVSQGSRQIIVGHLYQLTKTPVTLCKKVLQSTPSQVTTSVVVRLSTMEKYCPESKWSALLAGNIVTFRNELLSQLPPSVDPKTCIHDLFQLRRQTHEIAASMRVSEHVLHDLLRLSGKRWVFVQPPYMRASDYPIIWAGDSPESTTALYQKSIDLGALGLVLGYKKLGFRTLAKDEQSVRNKLALPNSKIWLVSGLPLAMTQQEIQGILKEMGMVGQLLIPSRRQQRLTQSWQLKSDEAAVPADDVMKLRYSERDFWITISPFMPVRNSKPVIQVFSRRWQRRAQQTDYEP